MAKERFKIIPSVYLVLMKDDKVLLSRRYNTGYCDGKYSLPSGHLNGGETFKEAMAREAKEEIGIDVKTEDLKMVHTLDRLIPDNERVDFFFTVKKWQGESKNKEPDKCDDLSWFNIDDLPENTVPYVRQVLGCIVKNIIYSEREGKEV
jgi:8-oxo-dGTP diphosphatase